MSLRALPTELLQEIVEYLGPAFFRDNLGCLTLYKAWYTVARPIYLRELRLCDHKFRPFWAHPNVEAHLAVIREHVREIHLTVGCTGFLDEEPQTEATEKAAGQNLEQFVRQLEESRLKKWAPGRTLPRDHAYWQWRRVVQSEHRRNRKRLNSDMANLAQALRGRKQIDSLYLHAVYSGGAFPPTTHALDYRTTQAFLELDTNLTSLDLTVRDRPDIDGPAQICPMIRRHLRTLRSLRLHISPICPEALELDEPKLEKIPLQELIIRLDLWENREPGGHYIVPVNWCPSSIRRDSHSLIETRVEKLGSLMEHAQVACVLSARGPFGSHGYCRSLYDALDDTHTQISSVFNSGLSQGAEEALDKNRISHNN